MTAADDVLAAPLSVLGLNIRATNAHSTTASALSGMSWPRQRSKSYNSQTWARSP